MRSSCHCDAYTSSVTKIHGPDPHYITEIAIFTSQLSCGKDLEAARGILASATLQSAFLLKDLIWKQQGVRWTDPAWPSQGQLSVEKICPIGSKRDNDAK